MTEGTLNTRLSKVLFTYWMTTLATIGVSTTELLLHYQPRTRLDLLFPQIADVVKWRSTTHPVFTKHNRDMGMGYLSLNGWSIYGLLGWTFMT